VQSTKPLKVFTPLTSAEITEKRSQKKYKQLKPIQTKKLLTLHQKTPASGRGQKNKSGFKQSKFSVSALYQEGRLLLRIP
jgi:hypothetical protein